MPFDPTKPATGTLISSAELRNQFNALNDLITNLQSQVTDLTLRVTALENKRRGLLFNGLDNYAANPGIVWPATGTWEFWIKVTGPISDLWPGVAGDGSSLPGTDYAITGLPGIEFYGAGTVNLIALGSYAGWTNTVDWTQWHHLALTWDATASPKVQMFVDGVPVASHDTLSVPVSTPAPIQIGYPTRTNAGLEMAMSEVRLSSAVRYLAPFTPANSFTPDANTVALYAFAEQTGTTAADSSGNGNDLTLTALPGGTLPVWFVE